MPRQRFANLAAHDREQLLDIAAEHFSRDGLEVASLNRILAESGLSKGAYYYYFDDKEDLFATVIERVVETVLADHPVSELNVVDPDEFWAVFERLVNAWAVDAGRWRDLVRAVARLSEEQRRSPRISEVLDKATELYRAVIETGQRLGCVRTDLSVVALARLVQVNDAALDAIYASQNGREDVRAHADLVFDTYKRLLAPVSAPATGEAGSAERYSMGDRP